MATTATISSYTFSQLTDLIKRDFNDKLEILPQAMRNSGLVVETSIPHHTGDTKRFAERIHTTQYASVRDEGAASKQAEVQYGYEKDGTVQTASLAISITKRMRVAGKDQEMIDKITNLSEVCPATIDIDIAHRLTFGHATTYTDRDGNTVSIDVGDDLALFSAVHELTWSATTYSNIITNNPQFSKGSLENAEKLFAEETYDNLGQKMLMTPDCIVTTDDPNAINQVRELLNATANTDTSNSGTFNVYQNAYKHVISGRIATTAAGAVDTTKRKYWGLASMRASDMNLAILEQPYLKTPTDGNNGEDFLTENWNYLAASTYFIATVTGKWIKFSKGDGS